MQTTTGPVGRSNWKETQSRPGQKAEMSVCQYLHPTPAA